jgi:hypothetical protein
MAAVLWSVAALAGLASLGCTVMAIVAARRAERAWREFDRAWLEFNQARRDTDELRRTLGMW